LEKPITKKNKSLKQELREVLKLQTSIKSLSKTKKMTMNVLGK
jgi:hypothetical protein